MGKLHPAAEPLIAHAALLAPAPITLFLFSEAREKFSEARDEAVAAVACLRPVGNHLVSLRLRGG